MCICIYKPVRFITMLLVVIGGLNWGLVGLGGFLGKNLNVVNLLIGKWPMAEWIVYLLVGIAALVAGIHAVACGEKCACPQE